MSAIVYLNENHLQTAASRMSKLYCTVPPESLIGEQRGLQRGSHTHKGPLPFVKGQMCDVYTAHYVHCNQCTQCRVCTVCTVCTQQGHRVSTSPPSPCLLGLSS